MRKRGSSPCAPHCTALTVQLQPRTSRKRKLGVRFGAMREGQRATGSHRECSAYCTQRENARRTASKLFRKEEARRQVLHVFLPARQSVRFFFFILYLWMYSPDVRTATRGKSKLFTFFFFFFKKKMSCSNCEACAARLLFAFCVYEARLFSASCLRALLAARSLSTAIFCLLPTGTACCAKLFALCAYEARLFSASCLRALLAARRFLRFVRTKHG